MSSCHPLFDVTGTFNNPGPLGGYLVVGLVVAVLLYAFSFEKEYMFYQRIISEIILNSLFWM